MRQEADKGKPVNLKELGRKEPTLASAFVTSKKPLCHDWKLVGGPEEKNLVRCF